MAIPRNLSNLAPGADTSGVLGVTKGGTGLTSPGTNGNVLTSNGTGWTSSALPSSGALTLISTQTANNTSQYLTFTGVSGYSNYLLILNNTIPATSGANPYLMFGTGATPTWQTSSYSWVLNVSYNGTQALNQSSGAGGIIMGFNGLVNSSTRGLVSQTLIGNLTGSLSKTAITTSSFFNNGNFWTNLSSTGEWNGSTDVTAIRVDFGVNVVSGKASLYGITG